MQQKTHFNISRGGGQVPPLPMPAGAHVHMAINDVERERVYHVS